MASQKRKEDERCGLHWNAKCYVPPAKSHEWDLAMETLVYLTEEEAYNIRKAGEGGTTMRAAVCKGCENEAFVYCWISTRI